MGNTIGRGADAIEGVLGGVGSLLGGITAISVISAVVIVVFLILIFDNTNKIKNNSAAVRKHFESL